MQGPTVAFDDDDGYNSLNNSNSGSSKRARQSHVGDIVFSSNECSSSSTLPLDDWSWLEVLKYLTLKDRLVMRRVCRKWEELCDISLRSTKTLLCWKQQNHVGFITSSRKANEPPHRWKLLDARGVETILRHAPLITRLDLRNTEYSDELYAAVARLVPNIKSLQMRVNPTLRGGIAELANYCTSLEELYLQGSLRSIDYRHGGRSKLDKHLEYCRYYGALFSLLENNPRLKKLEFSHACLTPKVFENWPGRGCSVEIEELVFDDCVALDRSEREDLLYAIKHDVVVECRNLRKLSIRFLFDDTYCHVLPYLKSSQGQLLTHLVVVGYQGDDTEELLKGVFARCQQMAYVEVEDCDYFSGECLVQLSRDKLEDLLLQDNRRANTRFVLEVFLRQCSRNMTRLNSLNVTYTPLAESAVAAAEQPPPPYLRQLRCDELPVNLKKLGMFACLGTGCRLPANLRTLELTEEHAAELCRCMVDVNCLASVAAQTKYLKYLVLRDCMELEDQAIVVLSKLRCLTRIVLVQCPRLTGCGLVGIASLTDVTVRRCRQVAVEQLCDLVRRNDGLALLSWRDHPRKESLSVAEYCFLLRIAIEATRRRTNHCTLTIVCNFPGARKMEYYPFAAGILDNTSRASSSSPLLKIRNVSDCASDARA